MLAPPWVRHLPIHCDSGRGVQGTKAISTQCNNESGEGKGITEGLRKWPQSSPQHRANICIAHCSLWRASSIISIAASFSQAFFFFFLMPTLCINRMRLEEVQWLSQGRIITKSRDPNSKFYPLFSLSGCCHTAITIILYLVRSLATLSLKEAGNEFQFCDTFGGDPPH